MMVLMPECSPELLCIPKTLPNIEILDMCSLLGRLFCLMTHHDRRQYARLYTRNSYKRLIVYFDSITVLHKGIIYAQFRRVKEPSARCNDHIGQNDS